MHVYRISRAERLRTWKWLRISYIQSYVTKMIMMINVY